MRGQAKSNNSKSRENVVSSLTRVQVPAHRCNQPLKVERLLFSRLCVVLGKFPAGAFDPEPALSIVKMQPIVAGDLGPVKNVTTVRRSDCVFCRTGVGFINLSGGPGPMGGRYLALDPRRVAC
ncbi:hypothetical protein LP414_24180 [Polaromonas sp. P1(28)-13]|nr:hypothetical protein LP414_24180 [Polaromonas sp. P1(28)-13]